MKRASGRATGSAGDPRGWDPSRLLDGRWRVLGHPLFIACVVLLALNDHLFKERFPGWWTGKLSDVAGVAIVTVLTAMVIGPRWAFPLVGLSFVLLKTTPPVAEFARPFLGGTTLRDVTDLVALIVLWPLGRLMRGATARRETIGVLPVAPRTERITRAGLAIAGATLALTTATATSCGPSPAVVGVAAREGVFYAAIDLGFGDTEWARSEDGGATWRAVEARPPGMPEPTSSWDPGPAYGPLQACVSGGTCWRLRDQRGIESRSPGGTWVEELRLSDDAFEAISTGCANAQRGVLGSVALTDATRAPIVIVSLGAEGILRRDGDGRWERTGVLAAPPDRPTAIDDAALGLLLPFGAALAFALWLARRRLPSWRAGLAVALAGWATMIMSIGFVGVMSPRTVDPVVVIGRPAVVGMVVTTVVAVVVARRPKRVQAGLPRRPDVPAR